MLRRLSDILTVDQDSSAADVVKPLHQLDEGGLAGAGAADQPNAFAGADVHRQPVIQRDAMAAVEECHILEHDASAVDADRQRVSGVGNADRLVMDRNKFLHVVHRTLQVVDVHADITQIGVDDVVAGQHIGDVARRGMACDPQQQRAADHGGADAQQHRELRRGGVVISQPGPAHAGAPSADDARQPPILARFGAERFHHGVAGQGIGQRAADLGVPGIGDARRRRDIMRREHHRHRHIDQRTNRDDEAERRPMQSEQDHRAQQHRQRRQ